MSHINDSFYKSEFLNVFYSKCLKDAVMTALNFFLLKPEIKMKYFCIQTKINPCTLQPMNPTH